LGSRYSEKLREISIKGRFDEFDERILLRTFEDACFSVDCPEGRMSWGEGMPALSLCLIL